MDPDVRAKAAEQLGTFGALAEALEDLVFVTEPTGKMLWANSALEKHTGFRVEDFWFENQDNPFIHPEDLPRVGGFLGEFAVSDATRSTPIDNRFIDKWGRVLSYRSVISKVDWDGAPAFLVVAERITDAETSSASVGESYQHLVESASDGIVKLGPKGTLHFSNRRFHELVGQNAVELKGKTICELAVEEDRQLVRDALRSVADTEVHAFSVRLAGPDGARAVDIRINRLTGGLEDGLLLAVVRDMTESRRLEAKLRQSQKLESLGVLAAGIAHDFNNIVTGIVANAELASELAPEGSPLSEMLTDLTWAGNQAAELTRTLLAYIGRAPTELTVIDVNALVTEQERLWRSMVDRSVAIEVHPAAGPLRARVDRAQLVQVLMNLVTNAAEASGSTRVRVSIRPCDIESSPAGRWLPSEPEPGRYLEAEVADDGAGMSEAVLHRIFDPFFSTKTTGRGMGLAAVLGIVKSHGGAMAIDTELDRGTVFRVVLPTTEEKVAAPAVPAPRRDVVHGGKILVVDDEAAIRRAAGRILRALGYEVIPIADGAGAIATFEAEPTEIRAVIIDHTMPGMGGAELMRRLRQTRPGLPVVHSSGYRTELGVDDDARTVFLPKPYGSTALSAALEKALDGA